MLYEGFSVSLVLFLCLALLLICARLCSRHSLVAYIYHLHPVLADDS